MIRHRSGARRHWLDNIEAVDLGDRALGQIAAGGKIARVTNVPRAGSEKVRIQRNDNVCLVEAIHRINRLAEGESRTFPDAIATAWFILMPFRFRKLLQQAVKLSRKRGRCNRFGQDAQASAFGSNLSADVTHGCVEFTPRADAAVMNYRLRAVGVV